jgi:hypothetical protein|tara:strand:+ start:612 stop:827 length:216 start_codon:yes stop_codon:yes gene_type:complete
MNKQATQMTMEEMHKVAGGVTYTELRGVEIHRPGAASRRSIILRTTDPIIIIDPNHIPSNSRAGAEPLPSP